MPVYRYQAIDARGRNLSGLMPASDESALELRLKTIGLWLTEAALEKAKADAEKAPGGDRRWMFFQGGRLRRDLIDLCTLMTFQLRVGVPLVRALEVARQDCSNRSFQKVLDSVQSDIESGLQLHEALTRHPKIFSP